MSDKNDTTISERLSDWAVQLRPDQLNSSVLNTGRNMLVDIVGLCMAARSTDYVTAVKAAAEPGEQVVIGHPLRVSASSAALINGTAAHGEDFDDTFEGGPVHSGVVIVPAILAAAQHYQLNNSHVMLGITVGNEVLCRLALTVPKAVHKAGFHPTSVLGAFAATLGICAACNASKETTVNALGIVGSMSSGIIEYLGDGSWTKRMHPGWAAQSALRAVAMANAGFIGPRAVFEGKHGAFACFAPSIEPKTECLFDELGTRFVSETISFKPYPCGTMVQPYIDCAIQLHQRGVSLESVTAIVCKTAEGIVHRLWEPLDFKRNPPTEYAAKFSIPIGVALGLLHGKAGPYEFASGFLSDHNLMQVASLVEYEVDPSNPYPNSYTGHIRLEYKGGRYTEHEQPFLRGGVSAPLTQDDIDNKFLDNLSVARCNDAQRVLDTCNAIASMQGNYALIEEFTMCCN